MKINAPHADERQGNAQHEHPGNALCERQRDRLQLFPE